MSTRSRDAALLVRTPVDDARPRASSRKSVRKRDEIMAAATQILNARTYALATMTEIAAAMGLRDATLYYYFPSKQMLFFACHLRSMERFDSFIEQANSAGRCGADKLRDFLSRFIHDSARNGPLLYFGDYFHLEEEHRTSIAARADELALKLECFLKDGIADGSIRPCETKLVVQLLLGMLIWLAKWVPSVEGITEDRLLAALVSVGLHGLEHRSE